MSRKQSESKNITEEKFKEHECYTMVEKICGLLGIDLEQWYFGEATEFLFDKGDQLNVYYGNEEIEDITMSFDFMKHGNDWKLEDFSMTLD